MGNKHGKVSQDLLVDLFHHPDHTAEAKKLFKSFAVSKKVDKEGIKQLAQALLSYYNEKNETKDEIDINDDAIKEKVLSLTDAILAAADLDDDNKLNYKEFASVFKQLGHIEKLSALDHNTLSLIHHSNIKTLYKSLGHSDKDEIHAIFLKYDVDDDGYLNHEELDLFCFDFIKYGNEVKGLKPTDENCRTAGVWLREVILKQVDEEQKINYEELKSVMENIVDVMKKYIEYCLEQAQKALLGVLNK